MGTCKLGKGVFWARDGSEFCFNMACEAYTSQECAQSAFYQRDLEWPKPDTVVADKKKKRKGRRR